VRKKAAREIQSPQTIEGMGFAAERLRYQGGKWKEKHPYPGCLRKSGRERSYATGSEVRAPTTPVPRKSGKQRTCGEAFLQFCAGENTRQAIGTGGGGGLEYSKGS
jgi:hypothetical protein